MRCEWVERHLSEYHDNVLDTQTAAEIATHLGTCSSCSAVLSDYARFDLLIAGLPIVEPSPALRDRIFSSPEFHAIVRPVNAPHRIIHAQPPPTQAHAWRRITQIITVLVLLAGAGTVVATIAARNFTGSQTFVSCTAVPAGQRIIYLDGTTLKSEGAPLTCDPKVKVDGWSVSPNGALVAYVDRTTGRVHVVSAQGTNDFSLTTGAGTVVGLGLIWSPDSGTLAILESAPSNQGFTIWYATHGATTVAQMAAIPTPGVVTHTAWSTDSQSFAISLRDASVQSTLFVIHSSSAGAIQIARGAPIEQIGWTSGTSPQLVWQSFDGTTHFSRAGTPATINVSGQTAAAWNPVSNVWAVAGANGTILTLDPVSGQTKSLAQGTNVSDLAWSADGKSLAVITGGTSLAVVTQHGTIKLTQQLAPLTVTFSPNSSMLAFVDGSAVSVIDLATGAVVAVHTLGADTAGGLVWSSDSSKLAIWNLSTITVVGADGSNAVVFTYSGSASQVSPQWSGSPSSH